MRGVPYEREKHFKDALLTWRDAGWMEEGLDDAAADFFQAGDALVGVQDGKAVALALSCRGSMYHMAHEGELDFCVISGITTAYQGRKSGFAGTLTAELLALAAGDGQAVAGLGMFEQGFYDRMGFGNMPYWHSVRLRPSDISVPGALPSPPVRLGPNDWQEIHACRTRRHRCHGSINGHPMMTRMEMDPKTFVLGFRDGSGELSHHVQFHRIKGENGPLITGWLAFSTPEQFRDLMLLIKSLGDQVDMVRIMEIPGISLQNIVRKPLSAGRQTMGAQGGAAGIRSLSWTQCRILDLEKCVNGMSCPGPATRFNLTLADPVSGFLDDSFRWKGCGGDYTVDFSNSSSVSRGHTPGLPSMECSVNTFTRLWNGTTAPSLLMYTDWINAEEKLLKALDRCLPLPLPGYDWEL